MALQEPTTSHASRQSECLYFPKCLESVAEVMVQRLMEETNGGSNSM